MIDPAVAHARINPGAWLAILLSVDGVLTLLAILRPVLGALTGRSLNSLDPGREVSLATLWTLALLVGTAAASVLAARLVPARRRVTVGWWALAALAVYFLLDEYLQFHEHLNGLMSVVFGTDPQSSTAWVLPALVAVLMVGAAFIPFLLALPRSIAGIFCLAAGVFVLGSVGFELIDVYVPVLPYFVVSAFEEGFEMAGVTLVIFGILKYVERSGPILVTWGRKVREPTFKE